MNTLSDPADPRSLATAYALGELSADERTAFEQQMESDPALAELARETKDFCAVLDKDLGQPTIELQEAAKARVLFEADKARRDAVIIRHRWTKRLTLSAACLAVGAGGTWMWMSAHPPLYAGRTKFEVLQSSASDVYGDTRSTTTADAPKWTAMEVDKQLKDQEAKVEQARLALNDLQKKRNIVDEVPINNGSGNSTVIQAGMDRAETARDYELKLEQDVMKLQTQLKSLDGLKADQLIAGAQELGIGAPLTGLPPVTAPPPSIPQPVAGTTPMMSVAQRTGGGNGADPGSGIGSGTGPANRDRYAFRGRTNALSEATPDYASSPVTVKTVSGEERRKVTLPARGGEYERTVATNDDLKERGIHVPADSLAPGTESYKPTPENPFFPVLKAPLSTFSIDVDTASYSNVRRFLNMNQAPPPEAVRLEELVNYFPYDYAQPVDGKPFAVHVEMTSAPWNENYRLARIALKGKEIAQGERPAANLVFLVDVSGSMQPENKLPLVKQSLRFVVERLTEKDTVSLVTYAGESGVALPATNGGEKKRIMAAIEGLGAGGSTNGAGGISTAYAQAAQHFNKEGINRVVLATDGDFNVGVTSHEELLKLITEKAKTGVFLSVLGYGMGNTKDDTMELLADKGNGNYAYIDSLSEARKTLADQFSGTLVTIAKDVKIQIEFNPAIIRSYRLLGYENRMLAKEDFNNDKKDAGEIGAGHTVTALYELIPAGAPEEQITTVDGLKYQPKAAFVPEPPAAAAKPAGSDETMTVKLRWKAPDADVSQLLEVPVKDSGAKIAEAGPETKWAVAVAGFAAMLNNSQFNGLTWEQIRTLAKAGKGADPNGYRGEFLQLLDRAESVRR